MPTKRAWPDGGKAYRSTLQELRTAKRLLVDVQAGYGEWLDTGLSPQALGGRRVKIGWWAKIAIPDGETEDAFRARISHVAIRVVADATRAVDWKYYKVNEDKTDLHFIGSGAESPLSSGKQYSFPSEPGRIEVRLGGARPGDRGTVRIAFLMAHVASDDLVVVKYSLDKLEMYDIDMETFPDPPPLPDPG